MIEREMPPQLVSALQAARELEDLADERGLVAKRRAIAATGVLLLAAFEAGWRATELAAVLDLPDQRVRKRIAAARERHDDHAPALVVDPPLPNPHPRPVLQLPLEERDWLTRREAEEFAGVSRGTIRNWLAAGLLPSTDRSARPMLFWRDDLRRVLAAPRYNDVGVRYEALQATLGATLAE